MDPRPSTKNTSPAKPKKASKEPAAAKELHSPPKPFVLQTRERPARLSYDTQKTGTEVSADAASGKKSPRSRRAEEQLARYYDRLYELVNDDEEDDDKKIKAISKMFIEYTKILDSMPALSSSLHFKIVAFFAFYSRTNTKAYLAAKSILSKGLSLLSQFVATHQDKVKSVLPGVFENREEIGLEEAIEIVVRVAEHALRPDGPARAEPQAPGRHKAGLATGSFGSSGSNLEKEFELNEGYHSGSGSDLAAHKYFSRNPRHSSQQVEYINLDSGDRSPLRGADSQSRSKASSKNKSGLGTAEGVARFKISEIQTEKSYVYEEEAVSKVANQSKFSHNKK